MDYDVVDSDFWLRACEEESESLFHCSHCLHVLDHSGMGTEYDQDFVG
jgi:hypothetical protein